MGMFVKQMSQQEDGLTSRQTEMNKYFRDNIDQRSKATLTFLTEQDELKSLLAAADLKTSLQFSYQMLYPPLCELTSLLS